MITFMEPQQSPSSLIWVRHYPTVDQIFDGQLVQTCDFCNADQLRADHNVHCASLQRVWKDLYGALPKPSIPVTGLVVD